MEHILTAQGNHSAYIRNDLNSQFGSILHDLGIAHILLGHHRALQIEGDENEGHEGNCHQAQTPLIVHGQCNAQGNGCNRLDNATDALTCGLEDDAIC